LLYKERKIAQERLQHQFDIEMNRRNMVDSIRKCIKIQDILDMAAEQLGHNYRADRCTMHFNLNNVFHIDAEYCKPTIASVRDWKKEVNPYLCFIV
jgi:predicted RNA binding protein with dsRBD fold (UPF0201 family)